MKPERCGALCRSGSRRGRVCRRIVCRKRCECRIARTESAVSVEGQGLGRRAKVDTAGSQRPRQLPRLLPPPDSDPRARCLEIRCPCPDSPKTLRPSTPAPLHISSTSTLLMSTLLSLYSKDLCHFDNLSSTTLFWSHGCSDALSSIPCMHVCASVFHGLLLRIARIPPKESWTTCPSRPYFCFSVLFFPLPFCLILMPCSLPLILSRPCPYFCSYVSFAKQYNTDPLCLGLFSDYRNQSLLCLANEPTHHRVEENVMGFYSCLSCNTAPDCFGKLQVAGT